MKECLTKDQINKLGNILEDTMMEVLNLQETSPKTRELQSKTEDEYIDMFSRIVFCGCNKPSKVDINTFRTKLKKGYIPWKFPQ